MKSRIVYWIRESVFPDLFFPVKMLRPLLWCFLQTISYMAERIVGTGSFGIVFQVLVYQFSSKFSILTRLFIIEGSLVTFFQAKCLETGETVAIKKVLQDRRYKNRELQLLRLMDHPNVVTLKHCFFSTTSRDELFLNLVMEYVPETMYRVLKHYSNANQRMPLIYVKLYTYQVCNDFVSPGFAYFSFFGTPDPDSKWKMLNQIFRGLAYIHTVPGVCHRDVKPQNVLVYCSFFDKDYGMLNPLPFPPFL